jgi:GntR family transcriptional regulator
MKTPHPTSLNNTASSAPLYKEVRRRILDALARGEWQPGERLPNEASLARRFGVSVSTIRAGVGELTAVGVLVRRQGKGTYFARHDLERQQFRFSNIYDREQKKVLTHREITAMKKALVDPETRALLKLNGAGSPYVHRVSAILRVVNKPVAVMDLILPVARFPGLRQKDLEQTSENLYSVYQRVCGVTVVRMEERIHARTATVALARKLGMRAGDPILCVERAAFTFNDVPIEIRKRFYEGTEHHYLFVHDRLD